MLRQNAAERRHIKWSGDETERRVVGLSHEDAAAICDQLGFSTLEKSENHSRRPCPPHWRNPTDLIDVAIFV
ncbi:hypothetical protein [Mesorhizobium ciceri]|uniref:hypothetical protein n=1 Tax=Mesorhizobium TaxID=68287 RepID=UPI00047EF48A|nr:hypothetical protein [Mesorhizobium ciceri]